MIQLFGFILRGQCRATLIHCLRHLFYFKNKKEYYQERTRHTYKLVAIKYIDI